MITLHTLSPNAPRMIDPAHIVEIVEARFGGCGVLFADKNVPVHFWESKEQVQKLLADSK
jgi:hypothetical protein